MDNATCLWPDCDRADIKARGLCGRCWKRASDQGLLEFFAAPERVCPTCNQIFRTGKQGKFTYCSGECQREGVRQRYFARRQALKRPCVGCGEVIGPERRSDARYCSENCRGSKWYRANEDITKARASEWRTDNPDKAKDGNHRRRAMMRGSAVGPIDYEVIWERDNGCCWLCSEPVDQSLKYPEPMSKSWDHVIPVSAGGPHVMENIALSHLRCNFEKKARVLDRKPAWAS